MRFKYNILLISMFTMLNAFSQQLSRWNVNSMGFSVKANNVYLAQTIGQSSIVGNAYKNEIQLRQGFQQPFQFNTITNNESDDLNFRIYPNPNNGLFQIEPLLNNRLSYSISIYNQLGQLVRIDKTIIGLKKYNLKELEPGSYLIEIDYGQKQEVFNLIIIP